VAVGIVTFLATFISCIYFAYNMQIHIAILRQYIVANTELTDLLLKHGAKTMPRENSKRTCLHLALQSIDTRNERSQIYRPRHILTRLLIQLIEAGADVFAVDKWGDSPSDAAQDGNYERSWREALAECGYSPQKVYRKSKVEWEELETVSVEDELVETLANVQMNPPQWTPKTMQDLLIRGIRSVADIHKRLCCYSHLSLSHLAGLYHADQEWRGALESCGYDPRLVYIRSGVTWVELEDIRYDESEGEDETSAEDEMGEGYEMSEGDEMSRKEWEDEREILTEDVNHARLGRDEHYDLNEGGDRHSLYNMNSDICIDGAGTSKTEKPTSCQQAFITSAENQLVKSEHNLAGQDIAEMTFDAPFNFDMRARNTWAGFEDGHSQVTIADSHARNYSTNVWMQDNNSAMES